MHSQKGAGVDRNHDRLQAAPSTKHLSASAGTPSPEGASQKRNPLPLVAAQGVGRWTWDSAARLRLECDYVARNVTPALLVSFGARSRTTCP